VWVTVRSSSDPLDGAEEHLHVLLPAQDLPRRRGDLALGQDAGRDLVEQRLEQVVARAVDEGDLDVGASQRLGGEQAAEAGPDDDNAVTRTIGAHALSSRAPADGLSHCTAPTRPFDGSGLRCCPHRSVLPPRPLECCP
jgi:hypothetical protein